MEQQQIRVSFSISTKLLLTVVTLLLLVIGFLTVSTVVVLTEDKRAYTFQAQGTEALLAGREFTNLNGRVVATLRLLMSNFDPSQQSNEASRRTMRSILDNQSEIPAVRMGKFFPEEAKVEWKDTLSVESALSNLQLKAEDLDITSQWWPIALPRLQKSSLYFLNASKAGLPLEAVVLADNGYLAPGEAKTNFTPIIAAFVPIKDFGKEFRGSRISVSNPDGYILYDSDTAVQFSAANIANDPIFRRAVDSPVASGAAEFKLADDRILASFVKPGLDLVVISRLGWKRAMAATYALTEKFIVLGLACIAAAIIFALIFAKSLTAPLLELYRATKEVSSGKFDLNLKPRSKDEIGALGASFNVMSRKISELIDESMKKVQLENELAIASTVQKTLIPAASYSDSHIEIRSRYQSASQCGGDWWGFFQVRNRLCLMIADATGHGISSALITASARSCFSVMNKLAEEDPDFTFSPGAMLSYANRVVSEAASGQIMMTFFSCVLDFDAHTLTYASAGHNPPWLFSKSGESFRLNSLTPDGVRLGETPDVDPYPEKTLPISSGDLLFLYTDGLTEGMNLKGEQFGKKRVKQCVQDSLTLGPQGMIDSIMDQFLAHNSGKSLDDDVTVAAARIL